MRITVVGLGYVGLVTAAGLARWDHEVVGLEADPERLTSLLSGQVPLHEPGLDELVQTYVAAGTLEFSGRSAEAIRGAHVVMVAVGTTDADGNWQTATILRTPVRDRPAPRRRRGARRPVDDPAGLRPPARRDRRRDPRPGRSLARPGHAQPRVHPREPGRRRLPRPDRVVAGIIRDPDGHGVRTVRRVYHRVDAPILILRGVDASLSKLGANLFLATKISFANELARLCDAYGGRVDEVVGAMAYDARIGGQLPEGRGRLSAARACRTRSPRPSATRRASGSRRRSSPPSTRSTTTSAVEIVDRLAALTGGDARRPPDRAPRPDVQAGHRRPPRGARPDHRRSSSSSAARPSSPTTRWSAPGPGPPG